MYCLLIDFSHCKTYTQIIEFFRYWVQSQLQENKSNDRKCAVVSEGDSFIIRAESLHGDPESQVNFCADTLHDGLVHDNNVRNSQTQCDSVRNRAESMHSHSVHNFYADTYHNALVQDNDVGATQTECAFLLHDPVRVQADSVNNSFIDVPCDVVVQVSTMQVSQIKCAVLQGDLIRIQAESLQHNLHYLFNLHKDKEVQTRIFTSRSAACTEFICRFIVKFTFNKLSHNC